jgi:branched-chain amino acid transport system ATP-binding protein
MLTMLDIKNLCVRYGAVPALHNISLQLASGKITSIIGSNGSGKSSILRAVMGHHPPESGEILLNGENMAGLPAYLISKKGVSLIPEGRRLFASLTVEENLRLGAFSVKNRRIVNSRRDEIYALFPLLKDRRRQISGTMSGGEQQILAIARGLMQSPDLLMLDEPSLGVMPAYINLVFDTVQRLNQNGMTILLVEQNVERSLYVADYAYVLQSGRIVNEGTGTELLRSDMVRKAYLGL